MIPKIIHYIWLGGKELPALEQKCIETWAKFNPDYKIMRWDETNLTIDDEEYRKAYHKKQWAYCADLARMKVLYEHGGIYLDTDMEIIKPFDDLLTHEFFIGKEDDEMISGGIIGATINNTFVLEIYNEVKKSLKTNFIPIPRIITYIYRKNASAKSITVFDKDYFYPFNPYSSNIKQLLYCDITKNTYAIHHWSKSWDISFVRKVYRRLKRIALRSKYY
ncbi:tcdA/TcdB catalytic glycosyltransferase [Enterobacter hormaechei subsp. hoffmannii]|uniref:glycosyltransferase family 32 protein n=1 Tax=Enterobacter hormaechei TaxID=158836 RepID=UPI001255CF05|nr:glycosyltransferase [Enterobacter hormaechei]ELC6359950.1 tcdA/TcdB catalytic glycosyltransferase [Enterobacter hormaechei]MCW4873605.1 tcdA/TcdB catalytic glycosyltransferase [Enterobacter hormaechei subsp. hoffmannii]MDA4591640.1 tcdA/TcdB catalytic glycosyltransferase [Enterobacter hormaechei]QFH83768.1 tcdA/TcdB catalytic glycosyltransferase [Enterobacter hormaechei]VAC33718.1 Mannosyltransferase OCH1 and related enzymes [Enterobacter hormaechei]